MAPANPETGYEDDEEEHVNPQPEVEVPPLRVLPDEGPVVSLEPVQPFTCGQCYKILFVRNLRILVIS